MVKLMVTAAFVPCTPVFIFSAGMRPMGMPVMVTVHIRVVCKRSGQISRHRFIRRTGYASAETDSGFGQRRLGPAANASADQHLCLGLRQKAGQRAMPLAIRIDNLCVYDFSVLDIVELKLLRMSKMLKNRSVFKSYRNSHLSRFLSLK